MSEVRTFSMTDAQTDTVDPVDGELLPPPSVLHSGVIVNARYAIREILGSGGSAIVYAAHDQLLGRDIAIKLLRPDRSTPAALARLRRETVLAQRVQNERLVRIFDIGDSDYGPFITMERVAGESLRTILERGAVEPDRAIAIARDVLTGLGALHDAGIIHRDVKPGNILIGPAGTAKLTDFGLAKDFTCADVRLTQTDAVVGTAAYLSPEQILGKPPDRRSDLYALGVVLYEMLAGATPFDSDSLLGLMLAHYRRTAPDVRKLRGDVPGWLSRIIARLLEKNPRDRFQTASEVLHAFDRRSVGPGRRAMRLASLAIAGAIVVGGGAWQVYSRTQSEYHMAVESDGMFQAIDRKGNILWTRKGAGAQHATPMTVGGRKVLAAFVDTNNQYSDRKNRSHLSFLDPMTGAVLDSMVLASPSNAFPQFADEFGVDGLTATDLDRDGEDELIVSFHHVYWPSYTVVVEPRRRSSRVVLIASGHHRLVGLADVNGDGRDDLLIGGVNNRMGWYSGLAAIDVGRPATTGRDLLAAATGSTPDAEYSPTSPRALLWYALLPAAYPNFGRATASAGSSHIRFVFPDGRSFDLTRDGFLTSDTSRVPSAARMEARNQAYGLLRESARLTAGNAHADAIDRSERAAALALEAGDRILSEWAARVRLRAVIRSGQREEARRILARLNESATFDDIAFDGARQMHLQGWLEDAITWYETGLARRRHDSGGRLTYEYVEGAVLAQVELERWDAALAAIDRYCEQYPSECHTREIYENFVRWMSGIQPNVIEVRDSGIDLYRYWMLEFRLASGEDPLSLLPAVKAEVARSGTATALVRSLEAVLLETTGEHSAAQTAVREALEQTMAALDNDPAARTHLKLVRSRAARITRPTASSPSRPSR